MKHDLPAPQMPGVTRRITVEFPETGSHSREQFTINTPPTEEEKQMFIDLLRRKGVSEPEIEYFLTHPNVARMFDQQITDYYEAVEKIFEDLEDSLNEPEGTRRRRRRGGKF